MTRPSATPIFLLARCATAAALLSLAACGGGSAGKSAQPVAATPAPVPAPPAQTYQLVVTPVAGTPSVASANGYADGKGAAARFNAIDSFAIDKNGIIFVSDGGNCVIRKIATDGTVSTLAGSAAHCGYADGTGTQARFSRMRGLALDVVGNLYLGDAAGVRKVTSDGVVTTLAGSDPSVFAAPRDGVGADARFADIRGIALKPGGDLTVSDGDYAGDNPCGASPNQLAGSLRQVSLQGAVKTVPNTAIACSTVTQGPSTDVGDLRYDAVGNLYMFHKLVLVKSPSDNGYVTDKDSKTVGPASGFSDNNAIRLAPDDAGNVYFLAGSVYKFGADGTQSVVLGSTADTPADVRFASPRNDWRALTYVGNHEFLLAVDDQVVRVTLK
jgi:hypothetical protein